MEKISKNVWDNKEFVLFLSLIYFYCVFRSKTIIWITIPLYLIIIARYIAKNRDYGYKLYFASIFSLVALECFLLIYIYLFSSVLLKAPINIVGFLGTVIITTFSLFLYIRLLITGEYKKLPM